VLLPSIQDYPTDVIFQDKVMELKITPFSLMISRDQVQDLQRFVRLLKLVPEGLKRLKDCWRRQIFNTGIVMLNDETLALKKFKAISAFTKYYQQTVLLIKSVFSDKETLRSF
jgi:hypothetical protein